jgi:hypothetical protein
VATHRAIAATSEAIRRLLQDEARDSPDFASVTVQHVRAADLASALDEGGSSVLSVYLYRVTLNATRRNAPAQELPSGDRVRPPLGLDLHYLITAWAGPLVQQELLGYAVRALADVGSLPATLLNRGRYAGTFGDADTVELDWQPITPQEEWDVWQIAQTSQQPSATYVARLVEIASTVPVHEYPLVQTRELVYRPDAERQPT